jgi:hypothetical protein
MRVTVSHTKPKQDAIQAVDGAIERLLLPGGSGPVKLRDVQKRWDGDTLHFSFNASMAFFSSPIRGFAQVTDRDITIDVDLPPMLTKFISPERIEDGVRSRVRGLLT